MSIVLVIFLTACSVFLSPLENAGEKYRNSRDYDSLKIIYAHLSAGVKREEVEKLLGEPDYSPTDGLYFYSSSQKIFIENENRHTSPGLTVDYRDKKGIITKKLQQFQLRDIN